MMVKNFLTFWNLQFKRIQILAVIYIPMEYLLLTHIFIGDETSEFSKLLTVMLTSVGICGAIFIYSQFGGDLHTGTAKNLLSLPMTNGQIFAALYSYRLFAGYLMAAALFQLWSERISESAFWNLFCLFGIFATTTLFWILILKNVSASVCGYLLTFLQLLLFSPLTVFLPSAAWLPFLLALIWLTEFFWTVLAWNRWNRSKTTSSLLMTFIAFHLLIPMCVLFGYYHPRIAEYEKELRRMETKFTIDEISFPEVKRNGSARTLYLWQSIISENNSTFLWKKFDRVNQLREVEKWKQTR